MSKVNEIIEMFDKNKIEGCDIFFVAGDLIGDLRRLAAIEAKYDAIMSLRPAAYVTNSGKLAWEFSYDKDELPVKTKLFILPKDK